MKPKSIVIFACIITLFASACGPELQQYQPRIPHGGRAVAGTVQPTNNNLLLVASETGGLFKSTNGGQQWKFTSYNTTWYFTDIKFHPQRPTLVIATAQRDMKKISGGGIWISRDAGDNWIKPRIITRNNDELKTFGAFSIAFEPQTNRIWAGSNIGIIYSDDWGETWNFLAVNSGYNNIPVISIISTSQNDLKILTSNGVSVSTNRGRDWTTSTTGLLLSVWGGNFLDVFSYNQLAVSPFNPNHIYVSYTFYVRTRDNKLRKTAGLFVSGNNGTSWSIVDTVLSAGRAMFVKTSLSQNNQNNNYDIYYSMGEWNLFKKTAINPSVPDFNLPKTRLTAWHADPADMIMGNDNKTPLLLLNDGGLEVTNNNGLRWTTAGGGANGYNALQITEITGQFKENGNSSDLYFGTQDNMVWASSDEGLNWSRSICCEGFYLEIPRDYYPDNTTRFTATTCGPCGYPFTNKLFSNYTNFPSTEKQIAQAKLLKPGYYLQPQKMNMASPVRMMLTTNNGGNWSPSYSFNREYWGFSKSTDHDNILSMYTPILNGNTSKGSDKISIYRAIDIAPSTTPIVSTISGFGSLGIFGTMFAWYKPFAVNPRNPNHIIVPDIESDSVKYTLDGGRTWFIDKTLTLLVTDFGNLVFSNQYGRNVFNQITTIAFDPDYNGHILVGTAQAGIMRSFDYGAHWQKIPGSDSIPLVSSFYFSNSCIYASSYGRGLWKLCFKRDGKKFPYKPFIYDNGPYIKYKGALVPIRDIRNPDVCPVCRILAVKGGFIKTIDVDAASNVIKSVTLSAGELIAYDLHGKEMPVDIKVLKANVAEKENSDKQTEKIYGLYTEGSLFKGEIWNTREITTSDLPVPEPSVATLYKVDEEKDYVVYQGVNFDKDPNISAFIDDIEISKESLIKTDVSGGNFEIRIPKVGSLGYHTVKVKRGKSVSYHNFIIRPNDTEIENELKN